MTPQMNNIPNMQQMPPPPKIVINADDIAHIEALAEGAMQRDPALADRLLDELGRARVVASRKMPKTVVAVGSAVTYRDETTGQERRVTVVYPDKADMAHDRISVMTPVGVALLGLSEGDAYYWNARGNQRRVLTVTRVEQPAAETAGR